MKIYQEEENYWFILLRRGWGEHVRVGPYTVMPFIIREISNDEGHFVDIRLDGHNGHIVCDHAGGEFLLVEMAPGVAGGISG